MSSYEPRNLLDWLSEAHTFVGTTFWMRQASRILGTDWLLQIVAQVDPNQVATTVGEVRSQLPPTATPLELVQELTRRKALICGGLGLAVGLLPPGLNVADAFVNLRFQVELIYEIACVYGVDLHSAERKGEALIVLATGFGAERATGMGIQLAQSFALKELSGPLIAQLAKFISIQIAERLVLGGIPLLGACARAGTNAAFVTLVGNAAQRFYGKSAL